MNKKFVLMVFTSVFLLLATLGAQFIMPATAQPAIINVPKDYPTIQAAINAASSGDIINVSSGTYIEHVVVNKSISLIGENRSTTIIDGNMTGTVLSVSADDVEITGFTIQNGSRPYGDGSEYGILVSSSKNITISGNIIFYNDAAIFLNYSSGNIINDNTISIYGWGGIILEWSYDNVIKDNKIDSGGGLAQVGVGLYFSSHNVISGNSILNNGYIGISVSWESQLNRVIGNTITKSGVAGIAFVSGNTFYHNNLINDGAGGDGPNTWDNGAEGNYWSDYNGTDTNGDGIGDTPYIINENNQDNYPLIFPVVWNYSNPIPVLWQGTTYPVEISSNSTISTFKFNHPQMQISFNATGPSGTVGFCNVTIPKALLGANETHPWQALLDGAPINYTKTENETHTTHHVQIIGTSVTPEFPTTLILPLLMIIALAAAILGKTIHSNRKLHCH